MESMRTGFLIGFLFVILMAFLSSSQAYKFFVGGKDGWVLNPPENYNHWAERNRFQVNDTLFFKYKKGSDSVSVVTKDRYNSCDNTNPIQSFTEGDSVFKFDRSGPFYFISGSVDHCQKGQKLVVVVLAVRNKTRHAPPPSPSPAADTPALPPTAATPEGESPRSGAPAPDQSPSDIRDAPAPLPSGKSSAVAGCRVFSVGLALVISIGVNVLLRSFV
ncbi:early nodulin-like protein 1 [Juglans microcarpa x Juglans regia]|uniref:early nodulin-like protein 1 n=1 Tax=Juglans microcarpa x Juglans regia TaxID=2249226 RepID=UPI001B7D960B|nr:early nodulin-like protein 1 [Juglans microcarpa x Juglans regia]